jgi:metal-responsive CopG/Arc/MetJ family transcriptional regulator
MRINISLNKELADQIKKIRDQENRQSDADTLRALIKEALKIRKQK